MPLQYSFMFVESSLSIRRYHLKKEEEETILANIDCVGPWLGLRGPGGVFVLWKINISVYAELASTCRHCPVQTGPWDQPSQAFKLGLSGAGSSQHLLLSEILFILFSTYLVFTTSNVFLWSKYHDQSRWLHFLIAWCTDTFWIAWPMF